MTHNLCKHFCKFISCHIIVVAYTSRRIVVKWKYVTAKLICLFVCFFALSFLSSRQKRTEREKVLELCGKKPRKQRRACTFMLEPYVNISGACSAKVLQRLHGERRWKPYHVSPHTASRWWDRECLVLFLPLFACQWLKEINHLSTLFFFTSRIFFSHCCWQEF